MFIMASNFLKNLIDWSWNDAPIFEIRGCSIHGESFACSCLTITHYSSIVSICYILNNILSAVAENIFLRWIMHDFIKFEFPWLLLIINESSMSIFWYMDSHMLFIIYLTLYVKIKLTEFIESIFKFLLQKFGVGLVLITTLTYYLPIFETYDKFKINIFLNYRIFLV